jgi:PKD repeat protein
VLPPKAWFTANRTIGIVPFEVTFLEQAFLVGEGCPVDPVTYIWDFGDNDCSIVSGVSIASVCPTTEEYTSVVPVDAENIIVEDLDGGTIIKTYTKPGVYDVTFTVRNKFGEDTIIFPGFIEARIAAPDLAVVEFIERAGQNVTPNDPPTDPPIIRSPANTFIDMMIPEGENPSTPGKSYGGELLDGNGEPIDPIITYMWDLTDDLVHGEGRATRASYRIGGIYDMIVRADTQFGSYRITTYEDAIDVVENVNMWLWVFSDSSTAVAHEFGLLSEAFKTSKVSVTVGRNTGYLSTQPNSEQQIREFKRNTFFAPRSTINSGGGGASLLYWATGRASSAPVTAEGINVRQFNGFDDTYITPGTNPVLDRPWNWVPFNVAGSSQFLLGNVTSTIAPNTSPTNQEKLDHNLTTLATSTTTLANSNYKSGASELQQNVATYDDSGDPNFGHFSVYRSTTKDGTTGYFARNSGVGNFFRIKSFYRTEGVLSEPLQDIRKMPDILGTTKLEGELVSLTSGVFFFNNSPNISAFDDVTSTWTTTGTNSGTTFSQLQDNTVPGFGSTAQPLLASSDNDRQVYLSYDYSPNAFMKFNETDLTFSSLGSRPEGEQWMMGVY